MTRRAVLSIVVPLVLAGGIGASTSASAVSARGVSPKNSEVCVVVWNDPNATGRDGICLRLPNTPNTP